MRLIKRPVKRTPRKKLRAAGQRSVAKYAEEDYSAEEPNVKLSRAFVVVLLLHVVAVGGIFAFSALKDQQTGKGKSPKGLDGGKVKVEVHWNPVLDRGPAYGRMAAPASLLV